MDKRIYYFDIIRFIAMTAVILNHSCGYFSFDNFDLYVGQPIYFIDCIINSLTRFNVPFFLMLSGGLILSNEKSTDVSYILHKTRRIIILLVFWTFSYSVIQLFS